MKSREIESISFEILYFLGKPYIQQSIYYKDIDGEPQGSSHKNNRSIEEAIELLVKFYDQMDYSKISKEK